LATIPFDPKANVIRLVGYLEGNVLRRVDLILDTGASRTVLMPHILQVAGFDPTVGLADSATMASGTEQVVLLTINRLEAAGQSVSNLEVAAMNLPSDLQADGLLGLNFLRHFHLFINFQKGRLVLQRQPPRSPFHKVAQWWELSRAFW
jgi:predicted aspartyl protease